MTIDLGATIAIAITIVANVVIIVWNIATMKASTLRSEQSQEKLETRQNAQGLILSNHDTQLAILNSRLETDIEELKLHRARIHEFQNTVMKGFFDVIDELRTALDEFKRKAS
jgi:uncharacterized protein YhhL (DUF1145 family)